MIYDSRGGIVESQMMAAVLYGKENLRVERVSVPGVDAGDILVRVRVALTCGTDVKVFLRGYHARMIVPPAVFGHELAGDVVAVGPAVRNFSVGQRVVAANSAPCGSCFFCRRGQENLCEDLLFNNGAYAEYIRIPARIVERNTYLIPDHVSYRDAALVEPLACVIRGFESTHPAPGDSIAIVGLGPVGLMFVRLAKLRGCRVIAVGRRKTQLDRALLLGADEAIEADDDGDPVRAVRAMTHGRGVDIAIEAVGKPETWDWVVNMVRRGGTVSFFGGCPNDTYVKLDTALLHYSEITCQASFHHTPAHIRTALELVSAGDVPASFFVNREEPLANLLAVMRFLMSHDGHLKTAIVP
jgi:L-iditol 2-dehydrogenase